MFRQDVQSISEPIQTLASLAILVACIGDMSPKSIELSSQAVEIRAQTLEVLHYLLGALFYHESFETQGYGRQISVKTVR